MKIHFDDFFANVWKKYSLFLSDLEDPQKKDFVKSAFF